MAEGTITLREVIEKEALEWGVKYAENVQIAIDKNEELKKSSLKLFEAQKQLRNVDNEKRLIELQKKIITENKKALEAYKKQATALKNNKGIWKEQIQLENNLLSSKKKNVLATESTNRALLAERENLRKTNLEIKQNLTSMGKLTGLRNRARQSVQNLNAQIALGNRLSDKEQKELRESTVALKKYDAAVIKIRRSTGQFQDNVGNYPKQLSAATSTLRNFTSALGFTAGIAGFVQVMRNSLKVMKDFEKQTATLSGILQVNRDQMTGLTEDSKRLGETTVKTASEVTELQIAFARLGFTQEEIINLTEATIQGSIAMNANLAETANLVGAVVNTFDDFSSIDAPEILDVMSLATAKSALNFQKLESGLPIVAGAANAAGVSFTKLVALLGKLADSGIDTSKSATAVRNIFIESAAQGLNFEQILNKIKNSQDKLTAANDEFGKRAAVSASVLSSNIDAVNELDESLQDAAGTAESMAEKELDTLDGALQLLKSAWQGIILEQDAANSITTTLKETIQDLAKNLKPIVQTLGNIIKSFLIYKAIMISVSLLTKAYTASMVALKFAKIALSGGIAKATVAMKVFNTTTKANPIILIISAIAGAIAIFSSFAFGVKEASDELREFNEEAERTETRINNLRGDINKYEKGMDRLSIATDAYGKVEDQLREKLEKEGVNITRVRGAIKLLTSARGDDAEGLNKQIDLAGTFTDSQKKYIRSAIINAQTLKKIISENSDFILKQQEIREEKLTKAQIKAQKKRAKDAFKLADFEIEQSKKKNELLSKDDEKTLNQRISFSRRALHNGFQQLTLERENAIRTSKKGVDELKLIDAKYNADREALIRENSKRIEKILADEFGKLKKQADEVNAVRNAGLAKSLKEREDQLQEDLSKSDLTNAERVRIIKKYEEDIVDIRRKSAQETIKIQINQVRTALLSDKLSFEQRASLEQQLASLKLALSENTTDGILDDIERQRIAEEKLQAFKAEKIKEASTVIADALNLDAQNLNNLITGLVDEFDNVFQGIAAGFAVLSDVGNAVFQGNIEAIDEQIEASENFYDKQFELAEGDKVQQDLIREEQEEKRLELEEKKRVEQVRQAKFQKAAAATQIALNTAQAIMGIWAQVPKFDFGISAGLLTAFVAALGAAQIAAVLAKPIPKYSKGTESHAGGPALVAEDRPEVIEEPNKNPYIVHKRSVLDLARGTKVHSSIGDYEQIKAASIMTSFDIQSNNLNNNEKTLNFNQNMALVEEMRKNREALEKKKLETSVIQNPPPDINHHIFRMKNIYWS